MTVLRSLFASTALVVAATAVTAKDLTITVWAGGTGDSSHYRIDAIDIAADMLEREYALRGEELNITVEGKRDFGGWAEFKQAFTLSSEAGTAPNIVVTGHEDIAPWAEAGYIVPAEDYLDLDAYPLNDIYENLLEISSFDGVLWGLPQDSESRPFFFWKDTMKAIGYTDEQIDALPAMVQEGEYTLQNVLEDAKKAIDMGLVEEGYGFYPRVSNGPDYTQFYLSFGGELTDPETGKLLLDKASMQGYFQFFADAVEAGITKKNHIGTDWNQWYNEVANGKAAMWHGGTWHYARYLKEGNEDFFNTIQFSLIPAGDEEGKANTITHPLVYLIANQNDDDLQDVAAQLIKIASEPRINSLHAIESAHLGISHQQSNIEFYAEDRWASEATERLLPYADAQPNHLKWGVFSEAMFSALESVWTGVDTPEGAVAALETELTAKLGDDLIVR